MKKFVAFSLAVALVGSTAFAGVKSGLEKGARVGAYNVLDITGPRAGEKLCYRCQYGNRPVVNIFARSLDANTVALIKQVDEKVGENKELRGFVTILTDNPDAAEKQLKEIAKKEGIKNVPLTVFENNSGPAEYKISKDADITVLMWNNSQVKVNHSYEKGQLCEECVKTVVADIPTLFE
jgi:hypothetical protein